MDQDWDDVRSVQGGDPRAFRRLVERHQAGLLALVHNLGLDAHAREDVAQEAFLAAYVKLATYDPARGSFRAWLYRIARNRAFNDLRRRRPAALPEAEAPCQIAGPGGDGEACARLDVALRGLPLERRAAFVLAEIHGLTHAEVAAIEGVALGTVKSRVSRARRRLREVLERSECIR